MIFNNLCFRHRLSNLSLELEFFLWQNVDRALPKSFDLFTSGKGLKVTL